MNMDNNEQKKEAFDYMSPEEVKIAEEIKQKNVIIKEQKKEQRLLNKPKIRVLKHDNKNQGFSNVVIIFIVAVVIAIVLYLIAHFVIGK